MECLNTEMLCGYVDNELEAGVHQEVTEHLSTCQLCADALRTLQEDEVRLREVWSRPRPPDVPGPDCYSAEALSAYVSGQLTSQEAEPIEQHLQRCNFCLSETMMIHKTVHLLKREARLSPPASLVATVRQGFGEVDQPSVVERLGALLIQVATDGLHFVEARFLPEHVRLAVGGQPIPAVAFRGVQGETEALALLDIQQTVHDLELHIRALHEDKESVLLNIHLRKQGKPVVRKRVTLSSNERTLYSRNTSTNGEVDFPRLAPGAYAIRIPQENVETQLILRSA
jgi:anti-sigma factor RsiW